MDRSRFLLVGLPVFLFCSDIVDLFTAKPPTTPASPPSTADVYQSRVQYQPKSQPFQIQQHLQFPTHQKTSGIEGIGAGNTVNINFCTSCSYKGNAVTMKSMLEAAFPGIHVILANHPPPHVKRLLSKVVPIIQVGFMAIILGGEHIFPRLGFATPPHWYYSMRANRFGSIAGSWLLVNFLQSFLQSSGAFEVYFNGELVFSKLMENRFPSEFELRDLIGRRLSSLRVVDDFGGSPMWKPKFVSE